MSKLGEVTCYGCKEALRPKTTEQIVDDLLERCADKKVYLIQEIGTYDDATKLSRWVRKNRRKVDQGAGVTRFMIRFPEDEEMDMIEYFYLEDPKIPKKKFPIQLYGIFDRVTINKSTAHRLKDDTIKMLGRAEKF